MPLWDGNVFGYKCVVVSGNRFADSVARYFDVVGIAGTVHDLPVFTLDVLCGDDGLIFSFIKNMTGRVQVATAEQ